MLLEDAGVVHQHVDPVHLPDHPVGQGLRLGRVGDVGLENAVGAALQPGQRLLGRLPVDVVVDRHAGAGFGERHRNRAADAAGCSGDQGDLAVEIDFHEILRMTVLPKRRRHGNGNRIIFQASRFQEIYRGRSPEKKEVRKFRPDEVEIKGSALEAAAEHGRPPARIRAYLPIRFSEEAPEVSMEPSVGLPP